MRIVRYSRNEAIRYGIIDEKEVVELAGDPMFTGFETTGERIPLAEITLLAPSIPRSKIVCVGKNYRDHAAEMGGEAPTEPLLFLKPNTSVIGPDDPIVLPAWTEEVEHEAELAVVIGKVTKNVTVARALDHVFGYTVANDVTARDAQRAEPQWTRAKGFDTSCPIGPWIVPGLDVSDLAVRSRVNGQARQDGRTSQLIFDVAYLVSYISEVFTLLPGDIILTGTPEGVGPIVDRDIVEVEVEDIGVLRNPVLRR
ncbi:MAG TPA: fumarylacetoacetate hydrolase family protein [Cellulomonas sp.]